ncbi:MAG: hypothetical protein IPH88_18210 [Bacteroidales bacterium]|nr:hypothetical protein [Bacteroidales bacterium]
MVRISAGKSFGFLDDVFIHPSFVTKHKLVDGTHIKGNAKTYNQEKKQVGLENHPSSIIKNTSQ